MNKHTTTVSGDLLRTQREAMGLSLEQVYRRLRIPVEELECLEASRWTDLPAPTYAVGFLKLYCPFLGYNPEPFIDAMNKECQGDWATRLRRKAEPILVNYPRIIEVKMWAAVSALLILGWVTYTVVAEPHVPAYQNRVHAGAHPPGDTPPPTL